MDPQTQIPISSPSLAENIKYGGAWSRFWAYFVDSILCGFFIFLFFDYLVFIKGENINLEQFTSNYSWLGLIYLVVLILYLVYFTHSRGATIGKDLYGLKVVQFPTHTPLTLPQTFLREALRSLSPIIPFIGGLLYLINGLMIIFSKEKRGFHDRISKTQVLKVKNAWPILKQLPLFLIILLLIIPPAIAEITISYKQKSALIEETRQQQTNQVSDDTSIAEWDTFTSSKYKYSINYPANWMILRGEHIEDTDKEKFVSISNVDDSSWIVIKILDQNWDQIVSSPPWISSQAPVTLASASGIEGEETLKDQQSPKIAKYIYLQHPTLTGAVVSIRVQGNNEENLNKVLNSLKFN